MTVETAEIAKHAGAKVLAVTGSRQSPLAQIADTTVVLDSFDYLTPSKAAINSAGMMLALRGLMILMSERAVATSSSSSHHTSDAYSALRVFTYRTR